MQLSERIAALRTEMAAVDLDAYVVPSADPHQSEYVAPRFRRRQFISGFDGSAGTVVIMGDRAGLWTDSRYFLQAEEQLAGSGIELFRQGMPEVPEIEGWLAAGLPKGARVGVDAQVFSVAAFRQLAAALASSGVSLVAVERDLVETVWADALPDYPQKPVRPHPIAFAGASVADKLARVRQALTDSGADALLLSALDEIAWLFNLRGADVSHNRVFLAYALVERERVVMFVDPHKLDDETRAALPEELAILPYEALELALAELAGSGPTVWIDPLTTSQSAAVGLSAAGARLLERASPVPAWKAAKNEQEIEGMRASHLRDGVAMVRFLRWLESAVPGGGQSELSVAAKVEDFRRDQARYLGPSFATIAGYGPNGAIVHYAVSAASSAPLSSDGILLFDSGGQYEDGTTDITRTLCLGTPTEQHKHAYTCVLRGHLRLSRTRFPVGTDGYQLDVLARDALWEEGLNYGHGTGHGVGAALCVHEGPFSVSPRKVLVPLQPGNVLSIEPGFYQPGAFGIRIENLALVVEAGQTDFGTFLAFETLTLCPYARELIDLELLSAVDRRQVDTYHQVVLRALRPQLEGDDLRWLERATRPL